MGKDKEKDINLFGLKQTRSFYKTLSTVLIVVCILSLCCGCVTMPKRYWLGVIMCYFSIPCIVFKIIIDIRLHFYDKHQCGSESCLDSHKNEGSKPKVMLPDDFTFESALDVYLKTPHYSCPCQYDYSSYFSSAFKKILTSIPNHDISLNNEKVLRGQLYPEAVTETKNITKRSNIKKLSNFVSIDTETTGLKPAGNDIIELCAIKFENFIPKEIFHTYLKPRKDIPAEATEINKITNEMVADAPTFSQIKSDFQNFIEGSVLVAHNSPFDLKFLCASGLDLEPFNGKVYDTLKLSRLRFKDCDGKPLDSYKLVDLCMENNIGCTDFHSADSDALSCALLYIDIIKEVFEVNDINRLLHEE